MALVDLVQLPAPYTGRRYRGPDEHAGMAEVLNAYRRGRADPEHATVGQMDQTYSRLDGLDDDLVLVEHPRDGLVAYARADEEDRADGQTLIVFPPIRPDHASPELFGALVEGLETHLRPRAETAGARYQAWGVHPGPGEQPVGEALWLEERGYRAAHWGASLVRPHLDDLPDRQLPDGVEQRPVRPEDLRQIIEAHLEAFRGEWDFHEPTEDDIAEHLDNPLRDESLWQVAWHGDTVVGQVKPFVNDEENERQGYLRGYAEYISTHHDWRNRGIAGTLLVRALAELRRRGMTEAALGVDTDNPGGAFQLYTSLGFELQVYEAVYEKPVDRESR